MSESANDFRSTVNIVSGLPRSGTSMMMKMLEAGGIPVLIDNIRKADIDNPKGYYEFERVKKVKEDQAWLEDGVGKVVKMVSMLLLDLPEGYNYKIVFTRREMKEILASQRKMLVRLGEQDEQSEEEAAREDRVMAANYRQHLVKVHNWLNKQPNIEVLYVRYNDFLADPLPQIEEMNTFFGGVLDTEKMKGVVDPSLYRNRA